MKRFLVIGAGLAAIAASLALYFYFSSDERRIRLRFEELQNLASKEQNESLLVSARKIQGVAALFDDPCTFQTHVPSLTGTLSPEDVSGFVSRARQYFQTVEVEFLDLSIKFPEENRAEVSLTSRIRAHSPRGEGVDEFHELACILVKKDGTWLFHRVEVVAVLEK